MKPLIKIRQYWFGRQKGIALITVLFLFAVATVVISGLVTQLHMNLNRGSALIESEQAYLLCLSGEEWARKLLHDDLKINANKDYAHEKWATYNKSIEVENGYIEISIIDAQSFFNINNLVGNSGLPDPIAKEDFTRLIELSIKDRQLSEMIAGEAADWLDSDSVTGTEEIDYLSESPSYRPPNSMITSTSELRWLKNMDANIYSQMYHGSLSVVTALPKHTLININTIHPVVLAALTGISIPQAKTITASIQGEVDGFGSTTDALQLIPANLQPALASKISTYSEYFEVRVRAKFGDHYAFLRSLIFRDHQNNGKMEIILRDRAPRYIFSFSKDYNNSSHSDDYDIDI